MLLALLIAAAPAQPTGFYLYDEGSFRGVATKVNCSGAGVTCTNSSGTATFSISGGGGGGAPIGAKYIVQQADVDLTNEQSMGALGTGLVINTTTSGVQSIKGTNTCTNQFPRSDNASGTWVCASVADADLASNYSGVGTCTNQFARVLNDNAAPTCASVVLTADVTGVLPVANAGTGAAPGADDQLLVSDSTVAATWRTVPNCTDTGGQHLNYTAATNAFSCGTSGSGLSYADTAAAVMGGF